MEKIFDVRHGPLAHGKESLSCAAESWHTAKMNYFQPTPPPTHEFHPRPISTADPAQLHASVFKHRPSLNPNTHSLSPRPEVAAAPLPPLPSMGPPPPLSLLSLPRSGRPSTCDRAPPAARAPGRGRRWPELPTAGGRGHSLPFLNGERRWGTSPFSTPLWPPPLPPPRSRRGMPSLPLLTSGQWWWTVTTSVLFSSPSPAATQRDDDGRRALSSPTACGRPDPARVGAGSGAWWPAPSPDVGGWRPSLVVSPDDGLVLGGGGLAWWWYRRRRLGGGPEVQISTFFVSLRKCFSCIWIRHTAKQDLLPSTNLSVYYLFFIVRREKRTTKSLCHASQFKACDKHSLPVKLLLYVLCRALPQKTHGKGVAVRPRRTANTLFPIVYSSYHPVIFFSQNKSTPATNQTNRLTVWTSEWN
jgi:hypothetical protein